MLQLRCGCTRSAFAVTFDRWRARTLEGGAHQPAGTFDNSAPCNAAHLSVCLHYRKGENLNAARRFQSCATMMSASPIFRWNLASVPRDESSGPLQDSPVTQYRARKSARFRASHINGLDGFRDGHLIWVAAAPTAKYYSEFSTQSCQNA